jgi:hypothetical protein
LNTQAGTGRLSARIFGENSIQFAEGGEIKFRVPSQIRRLPRTKYFCISDIDQPPPTEPVE